MTEEPVQYKGDLAFALINGEWVIDKSQVSKWLKSQKNPRMPPCPACGHPSTGSNDLNNVRQEGKVLRAECAYCGARIAIIDDMSV